MHSYEITPDVAPDIMNEVYSYPFPEVRDLVDNTHLPTRFLLNTIPASEASTIAQDTFGFAPPLPIPATERGYADLDELHVPVIDRIRAIQGEKIQGLESFGHTYVTPGSSEAMKTIIAEWAAQDKLKSIAVLDGEYEGYTAYANAFRVPVTRYDSFDQAEPKEGEVWFVSNPNALDGNWIDQEVWKKFVEAGHKIVYDAAYVGLTDSGSVDVSAPNILAVLTSPSKQFGVFRERMSGVAYLREPVEALYGSKWFKDVPALLATLALQEHFGRGELVRQYRPVQAELAAALGRLTGAEVQPSDTLLLANTTYPLGPKYARFQRGDQHRFGLTKLFEDYERRHRRSSQAIS